MHAQLNGNDLYPCLSTESDQLDHNRETLGYSHVHISPIQWLSLTIKYKYESMNLFRTMRCLGTGSARHVAALMPLYIHASLFSFLGTIEIME